MPTLESADMSQLVLANFSPSSITSRCAVFFPTPGTFVKTSKSELTIAEIRLDVLIDEEGAWEIAKRSRGTPRLAIRLLRRVRDFVQVRGRGVITEESAVQGCEIFGVDKLGLDNLDRQILEVLCVRFEGRPVGLSTLAVSLGEEPDTLEDVYEPYLLRAGLILRTPRGRVPSPAAWRHLGLEPPGSQLFYASDGQEPQTGWQQSLTEEN